MKQAKAIQRSERPGTGENELKKTSWIMRIKDFFLFEYEKQVGIRFQIGKRKR